MNYEEKYKMSLDRAMNLFVTNNISATAVCEIFPELNESEEVNYEKKYKKALKWMQGLYSGLHGATKEDAEHYFPELKESEDEKIKREIVAYINEFADLKNEKIPTKWLTWFEKQEEKKKVSIWKHWKNGIAGNGEGRQIYLIKMGNTYSLSSCLGFECDYIELSKLDNLMLEKQSNKSVNIDVESMVSSYEQRLKSQGGTKYSPLTNMCLTAFRHGVENVLEELNLKKLEKQTNKD